MVGTDVALVIVMLALALAGWEAGRDWERHGSRRSQLANDAAAVARGRRSRRRIKA